MGMESLGWSHWARENVTGGWLNLRVKEKMFWKDIYNKDGLKAEEERFGTNRREVKWGLICASWFSSASARPTVMTSANQ